MKKLVSLALGLFVTVAVVAQTKSSMAIQASYAGGDKEMKDVISGAMASLKSTKQDNGLLVVFTCNTCPFVIKNQKRTTDILAYAAAHKVGVALINSNEAQRDDADSEEAMKTYAAAHQYPNYLVDQGASLADYFGAGHTPEVFLFNASDELVYKGAMDDSPSDPESAKVIYLKEAIHNMVNGAEISPNTTKSIGCSIKRLK